MSRPWLFDAPAQSPRVLSQEEEALVRIAGARPGLVGDEAAEAWLSASRALVAEGREVAARLMDGVA